MYVMLCGIYTLVSAYWLARSLKSGVFSLLVGLEHEPEAKLGTLVVLIPILLMYNTALDKIPSKVTLMVLIIGSYGVLFGAAAVLLGLSGGTPSSWSWALGWALYWGIESFGSVCIALAWSIFSYILAPRSADIAAAVYPLAVVVCQVGALSGAASAKFTPTFGFPAMLFATACLAGVVIALFSLGMRLLVPPENESGFAQKKSEGKKDVKKKASLWDGLVLIGTNRYVASITVVSTFAELIGTVLDYQMKVLAKESYSSPEEFASFMATFGMAVNGLSLLFALTGTRRCISVFGLRAALLAYPLLCLGIIAAVFSAPSLTVMFSGMIALKSFNYSLNNPAKELLYLSTSPDVRFKAKSWIDMFGTRLAKGGGAAITSHLKHSTTALLTQGSIASSIFAVFWLLVASSLGHQHARLTLQRDIDNVFQV